MHYSEDEDNFNQNQQHSNNKPRKNNWKTDQPNLIYQPDIFEPYTHPEQTRQSKQSFPQRKKLAPYNKNLLSDNPM